MIEWRKIMVRRSAAWCKRNLLWFGSATSWDVLNLLNTQFLNVSQINKQRWQRSLVFQGLLWWGIVGPWGIINSYQTQRFVCMPCKQNDGLAQDSYKHRCRFSLEYNNIRYVCMYIVYVYIYIFVIIYIYTYTYIFFYYYNLLHM